VIPGNTSSQGKKPTTPTIGAATSVSTTSATINFTESTWAGKSPSPVYKVVNNADEAQTLGTCTSPCSNIALSGLTSSTSYTVKVRLDTTYGVNSDFSSTVSFSTSAPAPAPAPVPTPAPGGGGPTPPNCCPFGGTNGGDGYCYYPIGCGGSCSPGFDSGYNDCHNQVNNGYCCSSSLPGQKIQCVYPVQC